MTAAMPPFQYDSLEDASCGRRIRLLELFPGRAQDPIRCELHTVFLDKGPASYEGLSYCWGNPERTSCITCNGLPFPVTDNLMTALQALRKEDTSRILWTDAICINQDSIAERNQQVAMMYEIYRLASRTVVWLGPAADNSDEALSLVPDLLALPDRFPDLFCERIEGISIFDLSPQEIESIPELNRLVQNREARKAFIELFKRQWFFRTWVIQEVTVSRSNTTVCCGTVELDFDDLTQALLTFLGCDLHVGFLEVQDSTEGLIDIWETRRKQAVGWPNTVLRLLMRYRWRQATDPRDKVYALCGIARDAREHTVRFLETLYCNTATSLVLVPIETMAVGVVLEDPDYGLDMAEVFTKVAIQLLTSPGIGLDLFSAIHPTEERLAGLPSWVPDWSTTEYYRPLRRFASDMVFELVHPASVVPSRNPESMREAIVESCEREWVCVVGVDGKATINVQTALLSEYPPVFQASLASTPIIHFSPLRTHIALSGIVIDSLEEIGTMGPLLTDPRDLHDTLSSWAEIALHAQVQHQHHLRQQQQGSRRPDQPQQQSPSYLTSPDAANQAFTSTALSGHLSISAADASLALAAERRRLKLVVDGDTLLDRLERCNTAEELRPVATQLRQIKAELAELEAEIETKGLSELIAKVYVNIGGIHHRRFARTQRGYFALVPGRAKVGDEIVVFKGASMPTTVRRAERGGGREIVGECYVEGVMQGEVWREEICEDIEIF